LNSWVHDKCGATWQFQLYKSNGQWEGANGGWGLGGGKAKRYDVKQVAEHAA